VDTLESLVERAQGGDQNAYGEIVRRFQDMAYGYAYTILGDFQLAEDAAQEAFVEAYHCLPNLREPRAFPGWFKRVVFKHCDRITRGKRVETVPMETAQAVAVADPGPEKITEQREEQEWALQAVHDLPARQREATTLYYINGYSQDEIAEFLEVPTTTVKSRLHTSRKRLRERMIEMIQETLKSNALPEGFTQETLERAVARAQELNKAREFDQAEELLRDVLAKAPEHPGALKELNRTLMWGQYHDQVFDERYNELVTNARAILAAGSNDEYVYHQLAETLMYIPRMPEAVEHIEAWIAKKGPNLERLGMLAWAKGCVAEYDAAEALWEELLAMAQDADPDAVLDHASMACMALVDCFASAGEMDRAVRVAQAGWELCRDLGDIPSKDMRGDPDWLHIFCQAGLDLKDVAQALLAKWSARESAEAQGTALCIRAWVEDFCQFLPAWLEWARARVAAGELDTLESFRLFILRSFRATSRFDELCECGQATWNLLKNLPGKEAEKARYRWDQLRFHAWGYIEIGDLDTAEHLIRRAMEESDLELEPMLIDIAAIRGEPSPPDLVRRANEGGVKAIDSYEMEGWYLIAREAAAAGDAEKAFDALRRALSRWSNGPFWHMNLWENDAYWGNLLDHPERKRLFEEKRQRIGPIYGELHYFPGW
jgi:RNA polymerase sigma factor (sigma-70 family)